MAYEILFLLLAAARVSFQLGSSLEKNICVIFLSNRKFGLHGAILSTFFEL